MAERKSRNTNSSYNTQASPVNVTMGYSGYPAKGLNCISLNLQTNNLTAICPIFMNEETEAQKG